ncbi:unnamed protein product, partial [Symbiodinium natans]
AGSVRLHATLHLSVVPRGAVSGGKERNLVAAIQFVEESEETVAKDLEASGFETYKPYERQTSVTSTAFTENQESGIVANLADLNKLGASAILGSAETEDGSVWDWEQQSQSGRTMSHLGAFVNGFDELAQRGFDARICGAWEGVTSEVLGSYVQRIEFDTDCIHAKISIMGQVLNAVFCMNCSAEPKQLDIKVISSGDAAPPPIPYIFKFGEDGSLHLCGPADSRLHRPTNFQGVGLCIMQRPDTRARVESGPPEPEPELTKDISNLAEGRVGPITKRGKALQKPVAQTFSAWRDPALAASTVLVLTGLFAARKSF